MANTTHSMDGHHELVQQVIASQDLLSDSPDASPMLLSERLGLYYPAEEKQCQRFADSIMTAVANDETIRARMVESGIEGEDELVFFDFIVKEAMIYFWSRRKERLSRIRELKELFIQSGGDPKRRVSFKPFDLSSDVLRPLSTRMPQQEIPSHTLEACQWMSQTPLQLVKGMVPDWLKISYLSPRDSSVVDEDHLESDLDGDLRLPHVIDEVKAIGTKTYYVLVNIVDRCFRMYTRFGPQGIKSLRAMTELGADQDYDFALAKDWIIGQLRSNGVIPNSLSDDDAITDTLKGLTLPRTATNLREAIGSFKACGGWHGLAAIQHWLSGVKTDRCRAIAEADAHVSFHQHALLRLIGESGLTGEALEKAMSIAEAMIDTRNPEWQNRHIRLAKMLRREILKPLITGGKKGCTATVPSVDDLIPWVKIMVVRWAYGAAVTTMTASLGNVETVPDGNGVKLSFDPDLYTDDDGKMRLPKMPKAFECCLIHGATGKILLEESFGFLEDQVVTPFSKLLEEEYEEVTALLAKYRSLWADTYNATGQAPVLNHGGVEVHHHHLSRVAGLTKETKIKARKSKSLWAKLGQATRSVTRKVVRWASAGTGALTHVLQGDDAACAALTVCYLKEQGIPVLSIHDAFLVPVWAMPQLQAAYQRALETHHGVKFSRPIYALRED